MPLELDVNGSAARRAVLAPRLVALLAPPLLTLMGGCSADVPANPSFPLTYDEARDELRAMRKAPAPLERPLVIAGGIHDPGLAAANLSQRLRRVLTDDARVIRVSFLETWSFDACRDKLLRVVQTELPSGDPDQTLEVDVIGISMGGLVARYAAQPRDDGGPVLRVRRLFTIATPHRGAALAALPTLDGRAVDMRHGSEFLQRLDEHPPDEVLAYVRLGDAIVGAENAAPNGDHAWWVPNPPLSMAHLWVSNDPRIVADIARRLRGEPAYAIAPAAPLPGSEESAHAAK